MTVDSWLKPKPELIRIKSEKDKKCLFCEKNSRNVIISEKDKEIPLCLEHFEALSKKLKNFH